MPATITLPTTSLPSARLNHDAVTGLSLEEAQVSALLRATNALKHAIRHGNTMLIEALKIDSEHLNELELEHLDKVLSDPDLTAEVRKYAQKSLPPELSRQCREILSQLRLYWFTQDTVSYLWERTYLRRQDMPAAMELLRRLAEAVMSGKDVMLLRFREEMGFPPRGADRSNDNRATLNQYQLYELLAADVPPLPEEDEAARLMVSVLLDQVEQLTTPTPRS